MAHSSISERLALLRGRGGARASAYWLLRAVTRLDVYVLYSTNLQNRRPASALPEGHRLLKLASLSDLRDCSPLLIDTLDAQSGCGVVSALRNGGRVYALLHEDELLSQLKIDIGPGAFALPNLGGIDQDGSNQDGSSANSKSPAVQKYE